MIAGFMFGLGASAGGLLFVFGVFALNRWFNGPAKVNVENHHKAALSALLTRNALTVETNEHLATIANCMVYEMNEQANRRA